MEAMVLGLRNLAVALGLVMVRGLAILNLVNHVSVEEVTFLVATLELEQELATYLSVPLRFSLKTIVSNLGELENKG